MELMYFRGGCADCGREVDITLDFAGDHVIVKVDPCKRCMSNFRQEGRDEGYREGYDIGEEQGHEDAKEDAEESKRCHSCKWCSEDQNYTGA